MALWRESLLAKKVLEGKTRGYRNHPQLERFKNHSEPLKAINAYLFEV
ncbi:pyrimidine dimer DNA glycosylase/endonuclease V [Thermotoga maritima]|nr:pyrimidine dimer DNA glycosylase/endonuclease V [Thermotoga maritima]AGL50273.1 pyrimidine dimer DNA glycosylase [Thermotoga maritima MSB8]